MTKELKSLFRHGRRSIRHWLIAHSALYRRWLRWRFARAMNRMETAIGKRLVPAIEKTAEAMSGWLEESGRA